MYIFQLLGHLCPQDAHAMFRISSASRFENGSMSMQAECFVTVLWWAICNNESLCTGESHALEQWLNTNGTCGLYVHVAVSSSVSTRICVCITVVHVVRPNRASCAFERLGLCQRHQKCLVVGSSDVVGDKSLLGSDKPCQLSAVTALPNSWQGKSPSPPPSSPLLTSPVGVWCHLSNRKWPEDVQLARSPFPLCILLASVLWALKITYYKH